MALTFKLEAAQMEQIAGLATAIDNLSNNIAKWQDKQNETIKQGFSDLVDALGDADEEQAQVIIDQVAAGLNLTADEVRAALNKFNQPKENENGS